ncbi:uncharacterized protein [Haliotis asinina]|uniref:uncharacterized protein n=1 Tax=Haliotis asinina TaxID=109174 RepID=UPI00353258BE
MLVSIQRCLCVLFAVLTTTYGFYVPFSRYSRRPVYGDRSFHKCKRHEAEYCVLTLLMCRQKNSHHDGQAFVKGMFQSLDVNENHVIEFAEFKNVLLMMGVLPDTYETPWGSG